jgi:hypothetical protein
MITLKETPYLLFRQPYSKTKTKVVWVINIHHNETIGIIKWYSGWRQYCFFPMKDTIWNTDCLNAVTEMIKTLMDERKAVVKKEDYKVVGVVAWTIADFQNWRVLNGHHSKQGEENTLRTYECKNTRYVCLTKPEYCCGWSFDEIVETDNAKKNDDYQEIIEHTNVFSKDYKKKGAEPSGMDASVLKRSIFPSESDFYFKD